MSIGIYKIENVLNGKVYIGQSKHIETRWSEHCRESSQTKSLISKAITKYGKENFIFQILEECEPEQLTELELHYIFMYNSLAPIGYNVAIPCQEGQSTFLKYSYNELLEIVEDIKNSDMNFKSIAKKYGLDLSMIYYINRGDYHTLPNEIYPLRKLYNKPKKGIKAKETKCIDCGILITQGATRCSICDHKRQQRVERPSRDELKQLIFTQPFTKIATNYGVSDNSIRKWCQNYNLPTRRKDIRNYTLEEWDKI